MKNACIVGLAVVLLGLAGCKEKAGKESSSSAGGVAIVDMDKIALAVGERQKITDALERDQKEVNAKFDALVLGAKTELEEMRKKAGTSPTAEQQKAIQARQTEMEQGLTAQRDQAINALKSRHGERINAFGGQVRPIASRLAKAQGFSLVIVPIPGLLWSDESIDLTSKVVDEINKLRQAGQFSLPASAPAP
ncbi:MAG: OmpH family outer membrane protein [Planctomycetota bacterium]